MVLKNTISDWDQRTLVSFSLTSRTLRALCLPHIFREIRVGLYRDPERRECEADDDLGQRACLALSSPSVHHAHQIERLSCRSTPPTSTLEAFLAFVQGNEHLASHICSLALYQDRNSYQPAENHAHSTLHSVETRLLLSVLFGLPNLQTLQIRDLTLTSDLPTTQLISTSAGRLSLKHLRLSMTHPSSCPGVGASGAQITALVSLFSSLGTFTPVHLNSRTPDAPFALSHTAVRALDLSLVTNGYECLRAVCASPHRPALTSLKLPDRAAHSWEIEPLQELLTTAGHQLTHLALGMRMFMSDGLIPRECRRLSGGERKL